ncbi:MAG: acyl-CoA--6-aminopenicillanic acid acyltransferase [Burkholderiales bacterium]|nr:acyl-CoA--6-aminopenicillanic acid acyltransferase [Burkholderiales bacterium]
MNTTASQYPIERFPLVDTHGSALDRGRQHGSQAAARVAASAGHYLAQLREMGLSDAQIRKLVYDFVPRIEAFDASYVEEMRGIAEGAQVEFESVVLINARTEILQLGKRAAREADDRNPDGCTGVVMLPSATRDKTLIHGQNWDWKVECAATSIVLRIRRDDGPDILTFTEAGGLARAGLNAAGIAITANYLQSDRDYRDIGVPLALIRRKVLEQSQLALALRTVYCTPKSAANNMIVSQAEGFALDMECAPDETFPVAPHNGLLVHANHFMSPVALSKLKDTGIESTPDSLYRDVRVREALQPKIGALATEDLREALFDDYQSPWSVCRPPRLNTSNNLSATVAMIIMEPARGLMQVAPLPALNREFFSYQL